MPEMAPTVAVTKRPTVAVICAVNNPLALMAPPLVVHVGVTGAAVRRERQQSNAGRLAQQALRVLSGRDRDVAGQVERQLIDPHTGDRHVTRVGHQERVVQLVAHVQAIAPYIFVRALFHNRQRRRRRQRDLRRILVTVDIATTGRLAWSQGNSNQNS